MNTAVLQEILAKIDPAAAKAFVLEVRRVFGALATPVGAAGTPPEAPGNVDYTTAQVTAGRPAGGWLSDAEVRNVAQRMTEAIAAEQWEKGLTIAIAFLATVAAA